MTRDEKAWLNLVSQTPCACCGDMHEEIHHAREGCGMAQRSEHWLAISLCVNCHRGQLGVHGDKTMLRIKKMTEMDLLAETIKNVFKEIQR